MRSQVRRWYLTGRGQKFKEVHMESSPIPTQYAPAQRASFEEIQEQSVLFSKPHYLKGFSDALPNIFLALNSHRQIVFANQAFLDLLGRKRPEEVYGLRPGEALNCIHAYETDGGCGTTEFCRTCGAVNAILAAIGGKKDVKECRITNRDGESLDLRICAEPFTDRKEFIFFVVEDISHEKRRRVLERIFFHDVLNTAGGVRGLAELLKEEEDTQEAAELIDMIETAANTLIEEINTQRALSAAETGDLAVEPEEIHLNELLKEVSDLYENHEVSQNRHIVIQPDTEDTAFSTDRTLVRRVLANMLKNALEAASSGEAVTIGGGRRENAVVLWVHNQGHMPRTSQLQVFQRSFSTKGKGRGLGTYSIKLLTERYLKGTASFTSTEADGTTFQISLPIQLGELLK